MFVDQAAFLERASSASRMVSHALYRKPSDTIINGFQKMALPLRYHFSCPSLEETDILSSQWRTSR
jgi:hypothetical protein